MGYALFTARKLSLNSRVNNLNAKLMSISNQRFALTQQIEAQQRAQNMREAATQLQACQAYAQAVKDGMSTEEASNQKEIAKYQSVFDTASDTQLWELQQKDSLLDVQQKSIETQLKAAQQELEAVEKTEESAIKNATAKYCG